jgi:hypothetical protein
MTKKIKNICVQCGIAFSSLNQQSYSANYCHVKCRNLANKEQKRKNYQNKIKDKVKIICGNCNNTFVRDFFNRYYCSKECAIAKQEQKKINSKIEKQKAKENKKLLKSSHINQFLEFKRVKKQNYSLKQYNACRG